MGVDFLAKLNIPSPYREALSLLKPASEDTFRQFVSELSNCHSIKQMTDTARRSLGLTSEESDLLIETLLALQLARTAKHRGIETFVGNVIEELLEEPAAIQFENSEQTQFSERLHALLAIDGLTVQAKARDLQLEHAHVFINGRIVTDLRPVFRDGPEEPPSAMVLFHTLKLSYFDRQREGERSTFYIALDESDLIALKDLLDRAENKSKTLRSKLEPVGIDCLLEKQEA